MPEKPAPTTLDDVALAEALFRRAIEPRFLAEATALIVCTDRHGHPEAHVHVVQCDPGEGPSRLAEVLDAVLDRFERRTAHPVGGVCVAVTRPGDEQVQAYDRAWFQATHRVCHRRRVVAYGVYVVSRTSVRAIHVDDAA